MSRTWSKAVVFAIAVVFAAAPFVFAQSSSSGSATSGAGSTSGTQPYTGSSSTSSQPSQTGTMGAQDTIHATVADVNHQHNTLKLKMQGGETVEFKVPEASMANLNKGDSVQVSIHKSGMTTQPSSGMTTQPSRPAPSPSGSSSSGSSSSGSSTTPSR